MPKEPWRHLRAFPVLGNCYPWECIPKRWEMRVCVPTHSCVPKKEGARPRGMKERRKTGSADMGLVQIGFPVPWFLGKQSGDPNLLQGLGRGRRSQEEPAEGQSVPKGCRGGGSSAQVEALGALLSQFSKLSFVLQARRSRRTSTWRWRCCGTGRTSRALAATSSPSTWRHGRCSTLTSRASSRSHIPTGMGAAQGGQSSPDPPRGGQVTPGCQQRKTPDPPSSIPHPTVPPDSPHLGKIPNRFSSRRDWECSRLLHVLGIPWRSQTS